MEQAAESFESRYGNRIGHWFVTRSGRPFWPMDPRLDDIDVNDIAHGLAMQCRFNGQIMAFYSVAQHSVLVSRMVPPDQALLGLMHDAPEAYVGDLIRPIKLELPEYEQIEADVWLVVRRFFHLPDITEEVKLADRRALVTERRDLVNYDPERCPPFTLDDDCEPHPDEIIPLGPLDAEKAFLERYYELVAEDCVDVRAGHP